jgi:hypothetical protein
VSPEGGVRRNSTNNDYYETWRNPQYWWVEDDVNWWYDEAQWNRSKRCYGTWTQQAEGTWKGLEAEMETVSRSPPPSPRELAPDQSQASSSSYARQWHTHHFKATAEDYGWKPGSSWEWSTQRGTSGWWRRCQVQGRQEQWVKFSTKKPFAKTEWNDDWGPFPASDEVLAAKGKGKGPCASGPSKGKGKDEPRTNVGHGKSGSSEAAASSKSQILPPPPQGQSSRDNREATGPPSGGDVPEDDDDGPEYPQDIGSSGPGAEYGSRAQLLTTMPPIGIDFMEKSLLDVCMIQCCQLIRLHHTSGNIVSAVMADTANGDLSYCIRVKPKTARRADTFRCGMILKGSIHSDRSNLLDFIQILMEEVFQSDENAVVKKRILEQRWVQQKEDGTVVDCGKCFQFLTMASSQRKHKDRPDHHVTGLEIYEAVDQVKFC